MGLILREAWRWVCFVLLVIFVCLCLAIAAIRNEWRIAQEPRR